MDVAEPVIARTSLVIVLHPPPPKLKFDFQSSTDTIKERAKVLSHPTFLFILLGKRKVGAAIY